MGVNKNFVVKNGLEVDTSLILADADTNRVGIGTSVPTHLLHVNGGIAATHVSVSGVTTVNTLVLTGGISIANTFGGVRQYLTGDGAGGITWSSLPELRTSQLYTATEDQVDFDYTSTVAYVDVFVNGVKLTENSYTYIPGVKIVLSDPAFADDLVEIIGYTSDTVGTSTGGATIGGITIFENDTLKGIAGFVTSINFVGPTVGVTSTGYGVTVYSAAGGGGGDSYWGQTATGIHTTSNVGIGTTDSPNALTVLGNASISGFTTLGIATVGTSSTEISLYVDGGVSVTGVLTAGQFVGDGSGLINITAAAVDTGWDQIPSVGLTTTANVGIGTTNTEYYLQIASSGTSGTSLYVYGSITGSENITIGGTLTSSGIGAGDIVIDGGSSLIDAPALISIGGTAVRILGDLYVDGTRTETSAVDLQIEDKIVGLGTTSTPTDIGADGGGIILYGDTNKEFLWDYTTNSWTSNIDLDLPIDKSYKINGESRLSYGQLSVPNAAVTGVVTASTVSAGNITASHNVTASGNVSASTFTGDGNALTGIVTSIGAGSNITISQSTGRVIISATGVGTGGGGGSNVSISDNPPASPFSGDLWYDSDLGRGFIYYVDDDSSQWVEFSPNGGIPTNTVTVSNNGVPLTQAISNINFTGNVSISTSIAGIATIGINTDVNVIYTSIAGIATYATTAGIATYAATAGIATESTYATTAGIATQSSYAATAGIATYSSAAGIATYAATAGVSTYSASAGIATQSSYAATAGIATSVIGGISSVTELSVSGISTFNSGVNVGTGGTVLLTTVDGFVGIGSTQPTQVLDVAGNVKATTFYGDGSGLTGVTGGISLEENSFPVGTANTIDFANNATLSVAAGIATISITNYWDLSETGITTTANIGIGTTNATSALTVQGDVSVSGVSTFQDNINFESNVYLGDNDILWFGDGVNPGVVGDLQIKSDGTTSYIEERTSALKIYSDDLYLQDYTNAKVYLRAQASGSVELNYDNSKKFETIGTGITVTGTTFSNQLSISGISTLSNVIVGGATTALFVDGDARITGILTVGSSSITFNGTDNTIGIGTTSITESKLSQIVGLVGTSGNFNFNNTVSVAGTVNATRFVGDGSGLTNLTAELSGIATDSAKLSGQDPCFYVNYDNLYNYPEKVWTDVRQGGVGTGVTITGISTSYTFSSPRTVAGVSTDRLTVTGHLYVPTSANVGPEVDVVVLYHGTIDSPGVTPLVSAQTFLNAATNPSALNLTDKIIFSVAYPQDAVPDWVNSVADPSTQFSEFGTLFAFSDFYFGDALPYAEAALLWVKEVLNSRLSLIGSGKSISRVYTFGHSQGASLVHKLNTMHQVDGVISNAPGPIDLLDRCTFSESGEEIAYTCNKIRVGLGSTSVNPDAYTSISLVNYLTGHLSPVLYTQALDDAAYQVNLMQTVLQPGMSTCTEYGPIEFNYYNSGGHAAFASNADVQNDIRNYVNSGITGSYSYRSVGIGTTNPTSKLHVVGDVKVGVNTSQGVILTSPNGTQYRLIVNDSGVLSTVAV